MVNSALVIVANHPNHTPLHQAVEEHDSETVEMLITAGMRVNRADREGETFLHRAARYEDIAIVEVLIKYRAAVNRASEEGETPLY